MKKAMIFGPFDLRIVDLPERTPGPGEAKAKMLVSVLGAHSVSLYSGRLPADVPPRQHPVTLCYTAAGEITEVGPGVSRLKPGDLVYPNFYRACGKCDMCRADRMVACREMPLGALNMMIGEQYESGLQDYIIFPEERFRIVRKGTSPEAAALTGSMSVAMNAVTALNPQPWETALVIGSGFLGSCSIQLLKLKGCRVVACDIVDERLERAREFGADVTVNTSSGDAAERILEACGEAPQAIVEVTGKDDGTRLAVETAGRGGRISLIGASRFGIEAHQAIIKGLTLYGIGGASKVQETIELIGQGKLDVTSAITHRFPFSKLKEALELKRSDPTAGLIAVYVDESRMPVGG